jgi:hypothetical protein
MEKKQWKPRRAFVCHSRTTKIDGSAGGGRGRERKETADGHGVEIARFYSSIANDSSVARHRPLSATRLTADLLKPRSWPTAVAVKPRYRQRSITRHMMRWGAGCVDSDFSRREIIISKINLKRNADFQPRPLSRPQLKYLDNCSQMATISP